MNFLESWKLTVQKTNPHPAPGCNRSPTLLCIFKRCNSLECSVHFFRGPCLRLCLLYFSILKCPINKLVCSLSTNGNFFKVEISYVIFIYLKDYWGNCASLLVTNFSVHFLKTVVFGVLVLRGRRINNFVKLLCLVALGDLDIWVLSTSFQQSNIGWPQQPPT